MPHFKIRLAYIYFYLYYISLISILLCILYFTNKILILYCTVPNYIDLTFFLFFCNHTFANCSSFVKKRNYFWCTSLCTTISPYINIFVTIRKNFPVTTQTYMVNSTLKNEFLMLVSIFEFDI